MKLILIFVCCFSAIFAKLTVKQSINQCVNVEAKEVIADVDKVINDCAKQGRRRKCYHVNDGKLVKEEVLLLSEAQMNKCVNEAKQFVLKSTQEGESCIKNIPILTISDEKINELNEKLLPFYETRFAVGLARCNSSDVIENGKAAIVKCLKDEFASGTFESVAIMKNEMETLIASYESDVEACAQTQIKKSIVEINAIIEKYVDQQWNDETKSQFIAETNNVFKQTTDDGVNCMQNIEYVKISDIKWKEITDGIAASDQQELEAAIEECYQEKENRAITDCLKKDVIVGANQVGDLFRSTIKKFIG